MGHMAQQDDQPRRALTAAIVLLMAVAGCETPPRARPWRHAEDTAPVAATTKSASRELDEAAAAIRANRPHTLRIHMDAEPRALEPMIAPSTWTRRITMGPVFETLLRFAPPDGGAGAGPGHYVPGLARTWRIDGDGLSIYFELEPNVLFHDGQAMTAGDVQFSLDTARDPKREANHLWPLLTDIKQVDKISPRMVRIQLTRPNGWILRALAEVPILPYGVYEQGLAAGGRMVGTGPWQVTTWKNGVVHLTRFPRYWAKLPAIPDIEFVYQPDAARAMLDAKRGDLDLVPEMIPSHWPQQASAPGVAAAFGVIRLAPPRFRALLLAADQPPFDDARVRRAVSLLVNRQNLCEDGLRNLARPIAGPVWPGGPIDGAAPAVPARDPIAAGLLLDQAGWVDADGDRQRERGKDKLKIVLLFGERPEPLPPGKKLEKDRQAIVDDLRAAGFIVDFKVVGDATFAKRMADHQFGAAFIEWDGAVDSDPSRWLETGGGHNLGNFSSPRVDKILAGLRAVWDPAGRVALASDLALAFDEEQPFVVLAAAEPAGLIARRVQGVVLWDGWIDLTRLSLAPSVDPTPAPARPAR
jgi:peptide/nickel transport system substrate-binding protein